MNAKEKQVEAVAKAAQHALAELGLERIRSGEFFGIKQQLAKES